MIAGRGMRDPERTGATTDCASRGTRLRSYSGTDVDRAAAAEGGAVAAAYEAVWRGGAKARSAGGWAGRRRDLLSPRVVGGRLIAARGAHDRYAPLPAPRVCPCAKAFSVNRPPTGEVHSPAWRQKEAKRGGNRWARFACPGRTARDRAFLDSNLACRPFGRPRVSLSPPWWVPDRAWGLCVSRLARPLDQLIPVPQAGLFRFDPFLPVADFEVVAAAHDDDIRSQFRCFEHVRRESDSSGRVHLDAGAQAVERRLEFRLVLVEGEGADSTFCEICVVRLRIEANDLECRGRGDPCAAMDLRPPASPKLGRDSEPLFRVDRVFVMTEEKHSSSPFKPFHARLIQLRAV